jgi:YD repeat-containing protein
VSDNDADGEFDESSHSTYDADENELTRALDRDGDGTPDRFGTCTHDANGNQLTWVLTDADGGELIRHEATYDAESRLLTHTEDGIEGPRGERPDGVPHYREARAYVKHWPALIEVDADGDGQLEMQLTAEFDADDNRISRTRDGDFDFASRTVIRAMDGVPDEQETYYRDTDGTFRAVESDGDVGENREQADGVIDVIERNFQYDAGGRYLSWEGDGRVDITNDFTTVVADGTFDGFRQTFDANGARTSWILDEGMDGTDDIIQLETRDENGAILTVRRDGVIDNNQVVTLPADGTDNWIATVTWYAPGYGASLTVDVDGDGTDDVISYKEYQDTPFGLFETSRRWDGELRGNELAVRANGTWDHDYTWTYDAQGRPLTETLMRNGSPYATTSWEYGSCSDLL